MNDLLSLSDLFVSKLFRIPDYQRGYAWGQSQLTDFWEDIINLTDDRFHYTGMLSLKELKKEETSEWKEEKWIIEQKNYKAFHVVDGQQRLTTFIIFLNSIICFCKKNNIEYINSESIEQIKEKYIVEYQKPNRLLLAYKFGYASDNPSFEYLRYAVLSEDNPGSLQETFYTLNLERAKNFFDTKVDEYYKQNGESGLNSLYSKLVNKLQFNIHYIDDDFDVFVAFETMNNRGKKLSNLEILKNRLIYLTTLYKNNVLDKDNKDELRKQINDSWKEVYYELGRNKKRPLNDDEYLRSHWSMYFSYSRSRGDDYIVDLLTRRFNPKAVFGIERTIHYDEPVNDSFDEEHIPQEQAIDFDDDVLTPAEIQDYVLSLKSVAKYWYFSYNPYDNAFNATNEEKKWIDRLNRIGINYFRTTVVGSYLCGSTPEERVELFKAIERFIFLCFRMARYQASYYSATGYRFGRELLHKTTTVSQVTKEITEKFEANIAEATETFLSKITGEFKNGSGYYGWYDLHYFLFEYEAKLAEKASMVKMDDWSKFIKGEKDRISIEHIFPQTPTRWYWRNQFRNYTKDEQRALAGSLGNLLPLSKAINSSLQNDEFELKKSISTKRSRAYCNGSNSEIEVALKSDWNPTEILNRGLHLLEFMEERWGFKFGDNINKYELLGIPFMAEEREYIPEIPKDDVVDREQDIQEEDNIKLSDYLKDKKPEMKELYNLLYQSLKEKLGSVVEVANTVFIGLRKYVEGTNFADVWVQSSQIKVIIDKPINPENQIGEELPESYNWSKMYSIAIKKPSDIDKAVNAIVDSANQGD